MGNVFITGCSSGFGHLTVSALAKAGHTVCATMRDAGLPDGFGAAAAEVYRRLDRFRNGPPPSLDELLDQLTGDDP